MSLSSGSGAYQPILKRDISGLFNTFKTADVEPVEEDVSDMEELFDESICPSCGLEDALIVEEGTYECRFCGVKHDVKLNMEQEWRYYGDSDSKGVDPNRVGMPTNCLLPESSLGSIIGIKGGDFSKLRQYHQYNVMPYRERSLWNLFTFIANRCMMANLPNIIIEDAKTNCKLVSEQKISRGSNRKGIIANCVYFSCKKNNVPRSMKEIAEIFNITVSEMTKGKKKYEDIMYQQSKVTMKHISSTNPFDYIDRFCSNLGLDLNIKYICQFIVFNAIRLDIFDDNTPPSIAAGAIFMVTNVLKMRISKVQVHAATKISEVTISKCFKKLNGFREILFPSQAIKQYNIRFDKNDDIKTYKKKVGKHVEGKVSI